MWFGRDSKLDNARSVGNVSGREFWGGRTRKKIGRVRRCGEVVGRGEGGHGMWMGAGGGGSNTVGVREGLRKVGVHRSWGVNSGDDGVKRGGEGGGTALGGGD